MIQLAKISTQPSQKKDKKALKEERKAIIKQIDDLQYALYAENKQSLLIVFQGIDAAGKDSSIRAVFSGLNPAGVVVTPFKKPTDEELEHDFLWRHYKALPERGKIRVFNRSHYENVLVTQVHKDIILKENLPNINTIEDVNEAFFEKRYEQINDFEKHLTQNGTHIIKFFLHISKNEQRDRFMSRIENTEKNYKFSSFDIEERKHWDEYQTVFEKMINKTSKPNAPWHVIPCDDKKSAQVLIAQKILDTLQKMNPQFPTIEKDEEAKMQAFYQELKKS